MKIEKLEDLEIWQLSRKLSRLVYQLSGNGAFSKDYKGTRYTNEENPEYLNS